MATDDVLMPHSLDWTPMVSPRRQSLCFCPVLDIKWPQWHTVMLKGQVAVDMRVVLPAGCEEDAFETDVINLLEEVGIVWLVLWKEVGCRKRCSTLAGQTKRSVEDVTKKARRCTGCTIAHVGRRSETRSQKN